MSPVLPNTRRFRDAVPAADSSTAGLRLTELRPGEVESERYL